MSIQPTSLALAISPSSAPTRKQFPHTPIPIYPNSILYATASPPKKRKFEEITPTPDCQITVIGAAIVGRFKYQGMWLNNQIVSGTIIDLLQGAKVVYSGIFKNNKPDGKNIVWEKEDGTIFIGDCESGCFKGTFKMINQLSCFIGYATATGLEGKFYFDNHLVYEGGFYKQHYHGNGTYYYANDTQYVGQFSMGKKEGLGVVYQNQELHFFGLFKNDMRDGEGLLKLRNGDVIRGLWEKDKLNISKSTYFPAEAMDRLPY